MPAAGAQTDLVGDAAGQLVEAGVGFIQALASNGDALSSLFTRDVQTNRTVLSVPLPDSVTPKSFRAAIAGLINLFGAGGRGA